MNLRDAIAAARDQLDLANELRAKVGLPARPALHRELVRLVEENPGALTSTLGDLASRPYREVSVMLFLLCDDEQGPIHRHVVPARGRPARHFPGPCTPDCHERKR